MKEEAGVDSLRTGLVLGRSEDSWIWLPQKPALRKEQNIWALLLNDSMHCERSVIGR